MKSLTESETSVSLLKSIPIKSRIEAKQITLESCMLVGMMEKLAHLGSVPGEPYFASLIKTHFRMDIKRIRFVLFNSR